MNTITHCLLSLNDYDYAWFISKIFVIEQENLLLQSYQNMAYMVLVVVALIAALGSYLVKKQRANPTWLLVSVTLMCVLVGLAANHYHKEIALNMAQVEGFEKRLVELDKPADDILKTCSVKYREANQNAVWSLSGDGGQDKSSIIKNVPSSLVLPQPTK